MESNPFALAGAVRSAIRCIGQATQRTRWTNLGHHMGQYWRRLV